MWTGTDCIPWKHRINAVHITHLRGVAQLGRASGLGPEDRRFKSCRPDAVQVRIYDIILIMNNFNFRNSKAQGDHGVLKAMEYYSSKGYLLSLPFGDNLKYDLLVDDGKKIYRIQCKTSTFESKHKTGYVVRLATAGGNRSWNKVISTITEDQADFVFIWCADETLWEIPVKDILGKQSFFATAFNSKYQVGGETQRAPKIGIKNHPFSPPTKLKAICGCGKEKSLRAKSCLSCKRQPDTIDWPSLDELLKLTSAVGFSAAGRNLGVSDNAIRKRIRKLEAELLEQVSE